MKPLPSPFVDEVLHKTLPLKHATAALKGHIQKDQDVAWAWFSVIANPLLSLASAQDAYLYAAMIMQNLFEVDMSTHPSFAVAQSMAARNIGTYTNSQYKFKTRYGMP